MASEVSVPAGQSVSVAGQQSYTWANSTTELRDSQVAPGSTNRVAGCWFGNSFTVNLGLNDGQAHRVSLYLLDYDSTSRAERIDVINAATGAVLDSETAASFHNGEYLTWTLSGNVQLRFTNISTTNTSTSNAVLSGIFIG